MAYIWKDRPNFQEYCAGCSNSSRYGCILDIPTRSFIERDYRAPSEFPLGVA